MKKKPDSYTALLWEVVPQVWNSAVNSVISLLEMFISVTLMLKIIFM